MRWPPRGDRDGWFVALALFLVALGLRSLAWHGHLGYAISLLAASENPLANFGGESGEREGLAIYLIYWLLGRLFDPGGGNIVPQQLVSFLSYCSITPALYLLCAQLGRPWSGAAGGLIYAALPASYVDAGAVNYVGFYVALTYWGFWLLLRAVRGQRSSVALGAALAIGTGILVRVSALLVPIVMVGELIRARSARWARVFASVLLPVLLFWLVSVGGPASYLSYRKRENLAFAFELNDPAQLELTIHRFSERAGHIVTELFASAGADSTAGLIGLISIACIPLFAGRGWRALAVFAWIDFALFASYTVDDLYAQHVLPLLSAFLLLPFEMLVSAWIRKKWLRATLLASVALLLVVQKLPRSLAAAAELGTEAFRSDFEGPMYPHLLVDEWLIEIEAPEADRILVPNRDVCYGWRSGTRVLALSDSMDPQSVDEATLCELLEVAGIDYVAVRSFGRFEEFQQALRIEGLIEEGAYAIPFDALEYDFDELEALHADLLADRLGYFPPSLFAEYRLHRILARFQGRLLGSSRIGIETVIRYGDFTDTGESEILVYRVFRERAPTRRAEIACHGSCCDIVPGTPLQFRTHLPMR